MPPVYFDVETDGLPPCNITVACTLQGDDVRDWVSRDADGKAIPMTPETADELAAYLHTAADSGSDLVTFNGAKFDLMLLHSLVGAETKALVAELTHNHLDLMLSCALRLGHYTSLDSLAKGSLDATIGKTASGLDAVRWWKAGEVQKLLDYCGADCKVLAALHKKATKQTMLYRLPRRGGSRKAFDLADALLPVRDVVGKTPHRADWMKPNAEILSSAVTWLPGRKRARKESE
jgi:DEAD/DEAH box helicase domain-containing protein